MLVNSTKIFRKKFLISGVGTLLASALFFMANFSAVQAFNEQINYQGKLTDNNNLAVADGSKCFKFEIYDDLTAGSLQWSEEWKNTTGYATTTNGLFSVMLGTYSTLAGVDFTKANLYLQFNYDPGCDGVYEETFLPRKSFGAVPAAFVAKNLSGGTANTTEATTTISYVADHLKVATTTEADGTKLVVGGSSLFGGNVNISGNASTTRLTVGSGNPTANYPLWVNGTAGVSNGVVINGGSLQLNSGYLYHSTADFTLNSYNGSSIFESLRVKAATGKVGIGLSTPTSTLSVANSLSVWGGTSDVFSVNNLGNATTTGNTSLASTLYVKDSKVGIGVQAPVEKLELASGKIRLDYNNSSYPTNYFGQIYHAGNGDNPFINGGLRIVAVAPANESGGDTSFWTSANSGNSISELMRIKSSGSVGIATTTPGGTYGEKLTVVGSSYFNGNATTTGNTSLASTLYVKDGNVGIGMTSPIYALDITTSASSNNNFLRIQRDGVSNGNFTITNWTSSAGIMSPLFWATGNSVSHAGVSFIGNVISGTDSGTVPIVKFQARVNNANVSTRPLFEFANGNPDTGGVSVMNILANGNVGIGNISPYTKLSLGQSTENDAGSKIAVYENAGSHFYGIGLAKSSDYGLGLYSDNTLTGDPEVFIGRLGNTGINLTNPTSTLSVNGSLAVWGGTSNVFAVNSSGVISAGSWNGTAINGSYINYNTTNLQVTSNQLNTIQNIHTGASPTFAGLTLNGSPNVYFSTANTYSSGLNIYKRGTTGDATASIINGTEIGYHGFHGWDGSAYGRGAFALVSTSQDWNTSAHGSNYYIYVTNNTSTSNALGMRISQDQNVYFPGKVGVSTGPSSVYALNVAGSGYLSSDLIVAGRATSTTRLVVGATNPITNDTLYVTGSIYSTSIIQTGSDVRSAGTVWAGWGSNYVRLDAGYPASLYSYQGLKIQTNNGTEVMNMNSSGINILKNATTTGRIVIGSTNPTTNDNFYVNGSGLFTNDLKVRNATTTGKLVVGAVNPDIDNYQTFFAKEFAQGETGYALAGTAKIKTTADTASANIYAGYFRTVRDSSSVTWAGTAYGVYSQTSSGSGYNAYAGYFLAGNAGGTNNNNYGLYANANPTSYGTNYGIYAAASNGGTKNYAGYFGNGNVYIANNLGIGVDPAYKLHVSGDSYLSGNVTTTGAVAFSNYSGVGTTVLCIDDNGRLVRGGPTACGGSHIIEKIYAATSSQDLLSGEVVVANTDGDESVARSTKAYDPTVLGVVSSSTGAFLIGGKGDVYLTLAGRLKIKVSGENGPIKRGDLITTSNTAGHGMLAKKNVGIYAIALEPFNGGVNETGEIIALMRSGGALDLSAEPSLVVTDNSASQSQLTVATITNLPSLTVQSAAEFYGTILVYGEAGFKSKVTFNKEAEFKDHIIVDADTAGIIKVAAAATSTEIVFAREYQYDPRVVLTPLQETPTAFWISDQTVKGFRVNLKETQSAELSFNWIALALNDGSNQLADQMEQTAVPSLTSTDNEIISSGNSAVVVSSSTEEVSSQNAVPADSGSNSVIVDGAAADGQAAIVESQGNNVAYQPNELINPPTLDPQNLPTEILTPAVSTGSPADSESNPEPAADQSSADPAV